MVVAARGRVCRAVPLDAQDESGYDCVPRGKRFEAVCGDIVDLTPTHQSAGGGEAVIERILPRRNSLFRQDAWRTKVFAANLDQVLFMVACEPPLNDALLTRARVACHVAGIDCSIVLNKTDLPGTEAARARLALHAASGVEVIELSARSAAQAATLLRPRLEGRTSLLLGASGVGKSTLVNALVPHAQAATQQISQALQSGRHTTTTTLAYRLPEVRDAWLMDSPGFQSFGLNHISRAQLADAFAEIRALAGRCRFYNCSHLHEPGCAVLEALAAGRIEPVRHAQYAAIAAELAA